MTIWDSLEANGWPGPANTGYRLSRIPSRGLRTVGGGTGRYYDITTANTVLRGLKINAMVRVRANNVTIQDCQINANSGKTGESANGTACVLLDYGYDTLKVDHCDLNGMNGVHAGVWHMGNSAEVMACNIHNVDDGIFSWSDPATGNATTAGDNLLMQDNYLHDFTTQTSNGHMDGYQTQGAKHISIVHNSFKMTMDATSCIAFWNTSRDADDLICYHNLMMGGGFVIRADDRSPDESGNNPVGGFSVTNAYFIGNRFSNVGGEDIGAYGIWSTIQPPTDGWKRLGNAVWETGQKVDEGNI